MTVAIDETFVDNLAKIIKLSHNQTVTEFVSIKHKGNQRVFPIVRSRTCVK